MVLTSSFGLVSIEVVGLRSFTTSCSECLAFLEDMEESSECAGC